ncbi:MarR family transcriptional regulator [Microbacterium sp. LRZ72]|uniref:MarR family winged helix-turn-helix transcriptional regulator n=1 Tax=Microbacterium sp. LRZ72 TaxID=2942481 RepID=UPI0029B90B80|nr:MarR family transcriptional regulator [Microbacterium sp. LRZ72]MDX2376364.1 MarR family transcriptional regulator [Microbacterium sp. LRZ72]
MAESPGGHGQHTFESFVADAEDRARERFGELGRSQAVPIGLLMRRVNRLMAVDAEQEVLLPEGLTWASFRVCFSLWVRGPMEPHRVAQLASMSRASVSAARKILVDCGYVTSVGSTNDQRSIVLSLTPQGIAHTEETYARHLQLTLEWLEPLSPPEQQILLGLLGKLMASPRAEVYGPGRAVNT